MQLVCLDLEGVLVPEIWIAFSEETGIPDFARTTRDEPDYDKLMNFRIELLTQHKLKLTDIQRAIKRVEPLPGAIDFTKALRELTQLIILSDTFEDFAKPLMEKLSFPTLFCNSLIISADGSITGYRLRQKEGKKQAVKAFKSLNMRVFAAGDSFNDLGMIGAADSGCLFRAPPAIRESHAELPCVDSYGDLYLQIKNFLAGA
ncbi:bifunctional phosphoserine phosphatase/homoserine phosphotransferase ThrH [Breznakiellaceae bacterium SP9]